VATQIVVMWVWRIGSAWGQRGVSVGMGGHSVVDETLGVSRHPGSPSTGGGNEGEAAGVATQIVVMWGCGYRSAWGQRGGGRPFSGRQDVGRVPSPGFPFNRGGNEGEAAVGGYTERSEVGVWVVLRVGGGGQL
jgi:hypothetical protein